MSARHVCGPLIVVAAALAVAQIFPGYGMFVALAGSFLWIAHEQRQAKKAGDRS